MKTEITRISQTSKFRIEQMEADKDHLHLLIETMPNSSVTQIVRKLKQESTLSVWRHFSQMLKDHFWKERTF